MIFVDDGFMMRIRRDIELLSPCVDDVRHVIETIRLSQSSEGQAGETVQRSLGANDLCELFD